MVQLFPISETYVISFLTFSKMNTFVKMLTTRPTNIYLNDMSLHYEDVLDALIKLSTTKSCGPDMIPPIFIKQCALRLADPLLFIFNLSLSTELFPTRWKPSYVIPIFKTGSRNNIEHY